MGSRAVEAVKEGDEREVDYEANREGKEGEIGDQWGVASLVCVCEGDDEKEKEYDSVDECNVERKAKDNGFEEKHF